MREVLVDTDILSLYFRGDKKVKNKFQTYLKNFNFINISIITYYEILSGLKYKDAKKQLSKFKEFCNENNILELTLNSTEISANLYERLRKEGNLIDDIDLLIAGIAIENELIVATNNENHFRKIKEIKIENWSK